MGTWPPESRQVELELEDAGAAVVPAFAPVSAAGELAAGALPGAAGAPPDESDEDPVSFAEPDSLEVSLDRLAEE